MANGAFRKHFDPPLRTTPKPHTSNTPLEHITLSKSHKMCDFIIWETYIYYGDLVGFFQNYPDHFWRRSGIYPNISSSSQNKFKQIYKISRPLHHPPLKISLVPETKTKHTTHNHRGEVEDAKSLYLVPCRSSPSTFNR